MCTPTTDTILAWVDRRRYWLFACIALLMLVGFNGQWRIGPDSAVHVTIARHLAEDAGYTHPTGLEQNVQPGLAYLTSWMFRLFGPDSFWAIDALMLACAVGVLCLTYGVMRRHFGRPVAVMVVCLLASNETFYRYGYHVLTDMPFLFGLMLMLLGAAWMQRPDPDRGWQVYAGLSMILASVLVMGAFRSIVLTVLAAGGVWVLYRIIVGPGRAKYIGVALVMLGAWALLWLMIGGGPAKDEARALALFTDQSVWETLHRAVFVNGPDLFTENLPEAMFGVDLGPWLGAPLGVLALVMVVVYFKRHPFWTILVIVFTAQWLLLITTDRYVLVVMPLLALAWWWAVCWLSGRCKKRESARVVGGVMLVLWFAPNLAKVGEFIFQQRERPFLDHYEHGQYVALEKVAQALRELNEPGDVFVADKAPQLTCFTGLPVYGQATLPTYGPARRRTSALLSQATRVIVVRPTDAAVERRLNAMKMRTERTIGTVQTPDYPRTPTYQLDEVRMHRIDWAERRRQRALRALEAGEQQHDGQADEQPGTSEQADDLKQ